MYVNPNLHLGYCCAKEVSVHAFNSYDQSMNLDEVLN